MLLLGNACVERVPCAAEVFHTSPATAAVALATAHAAVYNARIKRLVYGAQQPRLGADGSWIAMFPRPPDTPAETGANPSLNPASSPGPGVGSDPGVLGVTQPRSPHPFHPNIEVRL